MKTLKIFLFAFAIVLFSTFNVQSQSVTEKWINFEYVGWDTYSPELGVLTGTGTAHVVFKYDKLGTQIGLKANIHLTNFTSSLTGEIFMANVIAHDNFLSSDPNVFISRIKWVLKGNMGTRMVCTETWEINSVTGEMVSLEHNHKQW